MALTPIFLFLDNFHFSIQYENFSISNFFKYAINTILFLFLVISPILIFKLNLNSMKVTLFSIVYFIIIGSFMFLSGNFMIYIISLYILSFSDGLEIKSFYLFLIALMSLIFPYSETEIQTVFLLFLIITDFNENFKMTKYYTKSLKGHYRTLYRLF